jgi:hypothetical protein
VLFDVSAPRPIARFLKKHTVAFATVLGWRRLVNGKLLDAAEAAGFDTLLTGDQRMRNEQNMSGRKIAVVAMSCNNWPLIEPHVQAIVEAVDAAKLGEVTQVW